MITALLTDLYDFVKPAESLSDFMHGTGKTSGFNGLWTTNATYKGKIYNGSRPTEVNEELFISSSKYMNKWLPFFDMIDKFTNTVNNKQNFYGTGTYTGFLRLTAYITNSKPSEQVSDETMNMMPEEFTLVNKFTVETTKVKLVSATKPGCVFLGWYLTPDFSGERVTEITGALAKNVILYAKWDESGAAKVEFETDGGSEVGHVTAPKGGKISKPADPVKEGHKFLGWYTEAELTNVFSFDTALNENIKLYAKWEKN